MTKEKIEEYPKIRKLTRKDRKKLSELIKQFAKKAGKEEILNMVPSSNSENEKEGAKEENTDKVYELIESVMNGIFQFLEDEIAEWFVDLLGLESREQYDDLPFDIEINVIEQMYNQNGFRNFFLKASELYKKIRG